MQRTEGQRETAVKKKKKKAKKIHYWNSQCEHLGYISGPINEK